MSGETVKVMVRCRPMNAHEHDLKSQICVQMDLASRNVKLTSPHEGTLKQFSFDRIFDQNMSQATIYEDSAFSLVESVVEGYNGTIFAYGQTGCGKTFTMMGIQNDETLKGIIPRTFGHIMDVIETNTNKNFLLRCSYLEIYNEEIHDLLSADVRQRYELKESPDKGIFIKDLTMTIVKSIAELEKCMVTGTKNRSTGETLMNKESSRSHSIFTIYLETSQNYDDNNTRITAGKLNLVDLAGSERQSKTQATGILLKEATKINLSLSALGNVISALVDGKSSHIPYRDSKLTRLLQDSLGGNTKTVMIACVSPASYNYDEILGTLRYASRAKNIQNKPKVNEDPKDALLKAYADEIQKLKSLLSQQGGGMPQIMNEGNVKKGHNEGPEEKKKMSNEDKENFERELKNKNEQLNTEKKEKENLEKLVKEFQEKLFHGENTHSDAKLKEYEALKKKMRKQKKLEEKLLEEKKLKEREVLQAEQKFQSLQEEVEALRKNNRDLNDNLKNALNEIKDIQQEQETEKEDFLQSLRVTEQENKFLTKIVENILNHGELEKIKSKAHWSDEKNEYMIKPFVLKGKTVAFPKLNMKKSDFFIKFSFSKFRKKGADIIEKDKNLREVVFTEGYENNNNAANSQNSIFGEEEVKETNQKKDKKKNNDNGKKFFSFSSFFTFIF